MVIKTTRKNLRLKHKRRSSKKHYNKKSTKRNIKNRHITKRKKISKKNYQYGGLFNDVESARLREELKRIGFTNETEIDKIITDMGRMSQQHTKPNDFNFLLEQMSTFHNGDTEEFKEWIKDVSDDFEKKVETDNEDSSDEEN